MDATNPYARPRAALVDEVPTPQPGEAADRAERLLASVIDVLLLSVVVAAAVAATPTSAHDWLARDDASARLLGAALLGATWLALHVVPLSRSGQTWGKRCVGIRVENERGGKASLDRLVLRRWLPVEAMAWVPYVGPAVVIANLAVILRADRKCGHDHLAHTRVARTESNLARRARALR